MNDKIVEMEVQHLVIGMKIDLSHVSEEENRLDFEDEWVPISSMSGYGNVTVVRVDRDYLPDVHVDNGTKIPVLIED